MPARTRLASSWREIVDRLDRGGGHQPTPFQAGCWLDVWYGTLAEPDDITALPLEVLDETTGGTLAALPLIKREAANLTTVTFADLGITDYNAPVFTPGVTPGCLDPHALITAIGQAAGSADLLSLTKMPAEICGERNPFLGLARAVPSIVGANVLTITGTWEDYRRNVLAKKVRKELERSWRVFERDAADPRFERVTETDEAMTLLPAIEELHARRINERAASYVLGDPPYRAFYRALLKQGLLSGEVVLNVLRDGPDHLVAALVGLRYGDTYAMVRMAQNSEGWAQCSPGRLVIDQTIAHLFQDGVRTFDFTTGDYPYKDAFGVERRPLFDVTVPLSMRGRLKLRQDDVIGSVKARVRRHPRLLQTLKSLVGNRHPS